MYVKIIDLEFTLRGKKSKALAKNYICQIAVVEREFHEKCKVLNKCWISSGQTKNKHDDKNE